MNPPKTWGQLSSFNWDLTECSWPQMDLNRTKMWSLRRKDVKSFGVSDHLLTKKTQFWTSGALLPNDCRKQTTVGFGWIFYEAGFPKKSMFTVRNKCRTILKFLQMSWLSWICFGDCERKLCDDQTRTFEASFSEFSALLLKYEVLLMRFIGSGHHCKHESVFSWLTWLNKS